MADFIDYTNATEFEKFASKLKILVSANEDKAESVSIELNFREAKFELKKIIPICDHLLQGIPHFQYENEDLLSRAFDLNIPYWLLQCSETDRVVSEATGRLLLSALIQTQSNSPLFVRIGEGKDKQFIGFSTFKDGTNNCKSYTFKTKVNSMIKSQDTFIPSTSASSSSSSSSSSSAAAVVLNYKTLNLKIDYPRGFGYFNGWCPVESIEIQCVWPKVKLSKCDLDQEIDIFTAPIWSNTNRVNESSIISLRGSTQRYLLTEHIRTLSSESESELNTHLTLISVPIFSDKVFGNSEDVFDKFEQCGSIKELCDFLYRMVGMIFVQESVRLESELDWNPKQQRLLNSFRTDRINEKMSLLWKKFLKSIESHWDHLKEKIPCCGSGADDDVDDPFGWVRNEFERNISLIFWCISREIEWRKSIQNRGLKVEKTIPLQPKFNILHESLEERVDIVKLELELEENETLTSTPPSAHLDKDKTSSSDSSIETFNLKFKDSTVSFQVPFILDCSPPPVKLQTREYLMNPISGEVIALNQLKSDISAFKAANPDIKDKELGFIGFLMWHSPNDLEIGVETTEVLKISDRMADEEGLWKQLWFEEVQDSRGLCPDTFNQHVSFNHRSLIGQLLSDFAVKFQVIDLLEVSVPMIIMEMVRKYCSYNEGSAEAIELHTSFKELFIISGCGRGGDVEIEKSIYKDNFPLDKITPLLDDYEKKVSIMMALKALNISTDRNICDETERTRIYGLMAGGESKRKEFVFISKKDEEEDNDNDKREEEEVFVSFEEDTNKAKSKSKSELLLLFTATKRKLSYS